MPAANRQDRVNSAVQPAAETLTEIAIKIATEPYLDRLGSSPPTSPSIDSLADLMQAHLVTVPFENLDVFHQRGVSVHPVRSVEKILGGRGGWCFELNGAFAALLVALGFDVKLLGAAVLASGPNRIVDHLALEVTLDRPYLVDVGFGDCFITPLELNTTDEQDGGSGRFVLMPSPEGTTLVRLVDGDLVPQYRFKRVALTMDDLRPASERLYTDAEGHFRSGPVVTRLLGSGADRVTLTTDRLRRTIDGDQIDEAVGADDWDAVYRRWFEPPLPSV